MAGDEFLSASILNSAFQTFIESCNCTEHDQQRDAFIAVVQPMRDAYHGLLLKAQEQISSLESSQGQIMGLMQTTQIFMMQLEDTRKADKEAAAKTEEILREEATRWYDELISEKKQSLYFREQATRWYDEFISVKKQSLHFQEDAAFWQKEFIGERAETTRWFNEYRNTLQASEDKDSHFKMKGSESRAKVWKNIKDSPEQNSINQPLTVQNTWEYDNSAIASLVNDSHKSEADMYEGFINLLKSAFEKPMGPTSQGVKVLDTHKKYYLRGLAPDITVSVDGVQDPDATSVYMVIEVKLREDATHDSENLGQLIDYLLEIRAAQKSRRRFAGMLTSLKSNVIVVLESLENETKFVTHYKPVNLEKALDFIQETVLTHPAHQPPKRTFSLELGIMLRRLGKPTNSVVAEFYQTRDGQRTGNRMAVKRSHAGSKFVWSELKVLEMIRDNAPKRISSIFPELVYTSRDEREFGIIPVGTSLLVDCLPSAKETRQVLHDVLDALVWLHNLDQPLIHRDVRCQNVIVRRDKDGARGVLIDFDQVAISGAETSYRGGYLCCPRELIGKVTLYTRYIPRPRHDYEAFVLMANMLAFSRRRLGGVLWSEVTTVSKASKLLLGFWSEIEESPVWSQYLVAAQEEKPESLKDISRLFVYV